jgi:ADP-ribose pyrophosphatase
MILERNVLMQTVAACVLALDQGRVVIVEQYRKSLGEVQFELPGGNMEPGESPEETARRELLEETGYGCERLHRLGQAPVWGKLVALYFTDQIQPVAAQRPQDAGRIRVSLVPLEEVLAHVAEGRWMESEMVHALLLAKLKGLL